MGEPAESIRLETRIPASVHRVWAELADLGSHPTWMRDAARIEFVGDGRRGVGTEMRVLTRIGPFRTWDRLRVTQWEEGRLIAVEHTGAVSGTGRFEITPSQGGTDLTWTEQLRFPWWLGGPVAAFVARPVLKRVWRGNLARLADRAISGDPPPR